jgi:hypothetical protein
MLHTTSSIAAVWEFDVRPNFGNALLCIRALMQVFYESYQLLRIISSKCCFF